MQLNRDRSNTKNQKTLIPASFVWLETWAKEAADRIFAYEHGEIDAEDFDVAMERLHKELNSTKPLK